MIYSQKQIDRFWNNVTTGNADECWPWKLSTRLDGCGQVSLRIDGKDWMLKAHKVAWEIHNNTRLEPHIRAEHSCGNSECCNPHHVIVDLPTGAGSTSGPRGESHGRSILTEKQARLIRYRLNALTTREIADSFSVSFHTVWDIRKGITWRHI